MRVEERDALFQSGGIGTEGECDLPIHLRNPVDGAHDGGRAAIGVLMQRRLDGRDSVGGVREGKAELHAAGDPCAARANQAVFDDAVAIEHLAMIEFVVDRVDVPAQLRQDRDLEVLVFEIDRAVGLRGALIAQVIEHGVGVDRMRIHQGKGRIRIRRSEFVGGNGDGALPAAHRLRMHRERKKQEWEQESREEDAATGDGAASFWQAEFHRGQRVCLQTWSSPDEATTALSIR